MKAIGQFLGRILFWTYERGSWQWDLMCLFFLIVIFSTPQSFLADHTHNPLNPDEIRTLVTNWLRSLLHS